MTVKKSVRKATKPRKPTTKSGTSTRAERLTQARPRRRPHDVGDGRPLPQSAAHAETTRPQGVESDARPLDSSRRKPGRKPPKGVDKVLAAQEIRELRGRIVAANAAERVDFAGLETAFVRIAKRFSQSRGIRYGAWRDAGVPPAVLRRAGISRHSDRIARARWASPGAGEAGEPDVPPRWWDERVLRTVTTDFGQWRRAGGGTRRRDIDRRGWCRWRPRRFEWAATTRGHIPKTAKVRSTRSRSRRSGSIRSRSRTPSSRSSSTRPDT